MYDELIPLWREQVNSAHTGQRKVAEHPLDIYFGTNAASKPIFFLLTAAEPKFPQLSDSVSVEIGHRDDGRWTVVLTLREPSLRDSFMGMCVELVRRSGDAPDADSARGIFFETLANWRSLLTGKDSRQLSKEELRGLVAEIYFAVEHLCRSEEPEVVLGAWRGPFGAAQDFQFTDNRLFEVKAIHAQSTTIQISSAEQLDPQGEAELTLALVSLEEVYAPTADCVTLPELISAFREVLPADQVSVGELNTRIDALHIDLSDQYYSEVRFRIGAISLFEVGDSFPRIRRSSVPLSADRVSYRLRIAGFTDFAKPKV